MGQSGTIRDAYIAVEIARSGLDGLRAELISLFEESGIGCEVASRESHVSIAYGEGDVAVDALDRVASEIASLAFSMSVGEFEIFEGVSTAYDYLVINLETDACFEAAQMAAQGCMKTKSFAGGFRSHVSLLKFSKGSVSRDWAVRVIGEMNACQAAAQALGRRVSLRGEMVSVFSADRQCHVTKRFLPEVAEGADRVKTVASAA